MNTDRPRNFILAATDAEESAREEHLQEMEKGLDPRGSETPRDAELVQESAAGQREALDDLRIAVETCHELGETDEREIMLHVLSRSYQVRAGHEAEWTRGYDAVMGSVLTRWESLRE